jgi:hypothetical protein
MYDYAEIHPEAEQVVRIQSFPNRLDPSRIKTKDGRPLMRPIVRESGDVPNELIVVKSRKMIVEHDRVVDRPTVGMRDDAREFIALKIREYASAALSKIVGSSVGDAELMRLRCEDAAEYFRSVRDERSIPGAGTYPMLDAMIPFEAKSHASAAALVVERRAKYACAVADVEKKRIGASLALSASSDDDLPRVWELVVSTLSR